MSAVIDFTNLPPHIELQVVEKLAACFRERCGTLTPEELVFFGFIDHQELILRGWIMPFGDDTYLPHGDVLASLLHKS